MYLNLLHGLRTKPASAESLTSAADIVEFLPNEQCLLSQVQFQVKTATVSTGNIVITVKLRPVGGVSGSETTITTLTIPTATAAGKVYYKRFSPVGVVPGQGIVFSVSTAAAGGSAAGDGYAGISVEYDPETPANNSAMVASA